MSNQRGLSLLEVLVALAIMAAVVGSLLVLMGQQSRQASVVEERLLAKIVAENGLAAYLAAKAMGGTAELSGEEEVAGRIFRFEINRDPAPIQGYETVVSEVRLSRDGQVIASMSTLRRTAGEAAAATP